jgi:hypothetical protein
MKRSSGPRKTANLSESIHQHLNMYAISATAAGVSLLALVQPSEAKIVYTPVHHVILSHSRFSLDLNHDGITDFTINSNTVPTNVSLMNVFSLHQNRVWGGVEVASALPAGVRVGPNQAKFQKGKPPCSSSYAGPCKFMQFCHFTSFGIFCSGPWANATKGYLGLKFHIKAEIHFGWARLHRKTAEPLVHWVLTGYAYETIPNRPIVTGKTEGTDEADVEESNATLTMPTPEPATLGALAMGAPGLSIWRRKETALQGNRDRRR